jgi:DNA-binding response OmpR family regulator
MKSILLVEDEYDLGKLLREFLQQAGYKVTWVIQPAEALELLKEKHFI